MVMYDGIPDNEIELAVKCGQIVTILERQYLYVCDFMALRNTRLNFPLFIYASFLRVVFMLIPYFRDKEEEHIPCLPLFQGSGF